MVEIGDFVFVGWLSLWYEVDIFELGVIEVVCMGVVIIMGVDVFWSSGEGCGKVFGILLLFRIDDVG